MNLHLSPLPLLSPSEKITARWCLHPGQQKTRSGFGLLQKLGSWVSRGQLKLDCGEMFSLGTGRLQKTLGIILGSTRLVMSPLILSIAYLTFLGTVFLAHWWNTCVGCAGVQPLPKRPFPGLPFCIALLHPHSGFPLCPTFTFLLGFSSLPSSLLFSLLSSLESLFFPFVVFETEFH